MTCERCGATISKTASPGFGLCPVCLLGGVRQAVVDEAWVRSRFPQLEDPVLATESAGRDGRPGARPPGDAICFSATDFETGDDVLLSLIQPRGAGTGEGFILGELEKRAHLDHPSIAPVRDHGLIDGKVYVIESRPAGQPLREMIRDAGVSRGDVLKILPKISEAVNFAARRGVTLPSDAETVWVSGDGHIALTGLFSDGVPSAEAATRWIEEHPAVGTRVGNYVLVEQIGEGGFADVFRARQEQPVKREVALKILKLGMDTREVLARFAREREALAKMAHSGIASIYDAGATDAGRPFIVMELLDGEPITRFCDVHRLSLGERVLLLAQVCRAVEHGHEKGVVHRDLKPSNVMVSEEDGWPVAKVIDYGIALAAEVPLATNTFFTLTHQFVGSPAYMSPEQVARNGDVGARSDVYSLGCLLYELIAGEPPLGEEVLAGMGLKEVIEHIGGRRPEHPADRFAKLSEASQEKLASARTTEARALARSLAARGPSDVALKALAKDPADRYPSAAALADDLEACADAGKRGLHAPHRHRQGVKRVVQAVAGVAALVLALLGLWQIDFSPSVAPASGVAPEEIPEYQKRKPAVSRADDGTLRPVALFQFDGDLGSAIPGGPDMLVTGEPDLRFETAQVGGGEAPVLHFPRFEPSQWLKIPNVIGVNGPADATETNRWTLVMDVMFPVLNGPVALFQCHSENAGVAELYAGSRGLGEPHWQFYGEFEEGEWYRIAVASSDNERAQLYSLHVNGSRWGIPRVKGMHSAGHAFEDELILLSDGDQRTAEGYLGSVALFDVPLTDAEIAALGSPSASGIPAEFVPGPVRELPGGLLAENRVAPNSGRRFDGFGTAVAANRNEAWVGAPGAGDLGASSGVVRRYRFDEVSTRWTAAGRLPFPDDVKPRSRFGSAVAMTAVAGVVGAPDAPSGGAAYVYRWDRPAPGWGDPIRLEEPGGQAEGGGEFGHAVAMMGEDGVVVGAPGSGGDGAVFVFAMSGGGPPLQLKSSEAGVGRRFGAAVAAAVGTVAVGVPGGGDIRAGAVEVFERDGGGSLLRVGVLEPPELAGAGGFGRRLALSSDGAVLASATDQGAVHLFQRDGGGAWGYRATLTAPDGSEGSGFGEAIVFAGSKRLLVGARSGRWDGRRCGVVSVYEWSAGDDLWGLKYTIAPSNGLQDAGFGSAVATAGNRVWIGAPDDHTNQEGGGSAFPVTLPRREDQRFETRPPSFVVGSDVAISGATAAVGVPGIDSRDFGGQLQIYRRSGEGVWTREYQTPEEELTQLGNGVFARVAVCGEKVAVSAGLAMEVFERVDNGWRKSETLGTVRPVTEVAGHGSTALYTMPISGGGLVSFATGGGVEMHEFEPETTLWYPRAAVDDGAVMLRGASETAVTLFERTGAELEPRATIEAPADLPRGGNFGVAMDLDGDCAIVGAPCYDGQVESGFGGAAYVYDRNRPGAEPVRLRCPEGEPDEMSSHGWAVAIRGDTALVSNPYVRRGLAPGRVYVYRRDAVSDTWRHGETLRASNAEPGDEFGVSVGLDDGWAVIGAKSGWVYFFRVE